MFIHDIRDLAPQLASREAADPERYPAENIADLITAGVLAAPLPRVLGGRGARLDELVLAVEAIASASASTALLATMPLGLAGIHGIGVEVAPEAHRRGWAEQIEHLAANYQAGHLYAACNSEKGSNGELSATRTQAHRGADGVFRLTGEKSIATFGSYADVFFSTARVIPDELPGAGEVEFFLIDTKAPGVTVLADWNGFGMRSTESHSVRYDRAPALAVMGFPNFIETVQPLTYWFCLFAAIPLGCAAAMLNVLGTPKPTSPALRFRLAEGLMRYEALRAYLVETACRWRPAAGPDYADRVLRTKTYVTQEATRLCAELFALSGGRHYNRTSPIARAFADAFAGTALRPPLMVALDALVANFSLGAFDDAD